jgi:hypothetical protein
VSGVVVEMWGYSTLTMLAAIAAVPLVGLVGRGVKGRGLVGI